MSQMKFLVTWNGDDSPVLHSTDDYEEAQRVAAERSVGDWMGTRVLGPSGKIATYFDGERSGWLGSVNGGPIQWHREAS